MENYNNSSDNGQDKSEWQQLTVWRIAIPIQTLDKIKLNDDLYGELLFQF